MQQNLSESFNGNVFISLNFQVLREQRRTRTKLNSCVTVIKEINTIA